MIKQFKDELCLKLYNYVEQCVSEYKYGMKIAEHETKSLKKEKR